jgi:hypothetical protein
VKFPEFVVFPQHFLFVVLRLDWKPSTTDPDRLVPVGEVMAHAASMADAERILVSLGATMAPLDET